MLSDDGSFFYISRKGNETKENMEGEDVKEKVL